ncbi:carbohydrate-binding module family 20 domain-containing protein [Kitasatospora atroaurantiaca]|uniref:alpha-amylase n=1 Tax=Kitasatospora atroaurantiaca TaxID=285545 RepID=A0A561F1G7_9ACTN|nr:carbohydrate-binding module family 20 domain-containing protein [Kitasatospora atroaurantiaca]TWE21704.1 starch binding protein [Kitasatospora atroaurantiaca]
MIRHAHRALLRTVLVAALAALLLSLPAQVGTARAAESGSSEAAATETFVLGGSPPPGPLYLVGSVAALGNWSPEVAVPLVWSGHTWSVTLSSLPTATTVRYKYLAKDRDGNITWQPGPDQLLTTAAAGTSGSARDTWAGATTPVTTAFTVDATTWYGQNVYVSGSLPALGSWDTDRAVPLASANYPFWSGSTALPPNTAYEYKYFRRNPDGTVEWEPGGNRTATSAPSGSDTYHDVWR